MKATSINAPYRFPVSIKGVLVHDGRIPLLRNERDEWELPGGKLDPGETPGECVVREIREELNVDCRVAGLLDTWVYRISSDIVVLIVTYAVEVDSLDDLECSHEHKECKLFTLDAIPSLNMPAGYKESIARFSDLSVR